MHGSLSSYQQWREELQGLSLWMKEVEVFLNAEEAAIRDAALRELMEETGVEARLVGLADVVDAILENRTGDLITRHYVLIDYAAEWVSGAPVAGDDAAEAQFFHISDLASLQMWDETLRVIDAAASLLQNERKGET